MSQNPIQPFLGKFDTMLLDGGLATMLEARGYSLNSTLWSAQLLVEEPDVIRQLHEDFLLAGADCLITVSYQATIAGFAEVGINQAEAENLLRLSVQLACQARDRFWENPHNRIGRLRPLVAGSIGPYGAYLANGAEYTGDYGITADELFHFHRRRWQILATSGVDLLAVETLPSFTELKQLCQLLAETPNIWAWFSFSSLDGEHLCDGTPFAEALDLLNGIERVVAMGVNCLAPKHVPAFLQLAHSATDLPIIVYPNSGEKYDATCNRWIGEREPVQFGELGVTWKKGGAKLIGGCCRTMPAHITELRAKLVATP